MQIAQFLWGASYAAAHLFVQYDVPIATPYQIAVTIQNAVSSVSSAASAASSTVSVVIESPAASGTLIALAKKLLLRAVGEEGIAERVTNSRGDHITPHIEEKIEQFNEKTQQQYETRWRTDWTKVNCIDTSGEAFAIYLNLLYLAPLTFLFARFFVKAYTGRGKARRASHAARQIEDSGKVAGERTSETVERMGKKAEDEIIKAEAELHKVDVKDIHEQLRRDVEAMKKGTWNRGGRRVSDHIQNFERQVKSAAESVKERSKKMTGATGSPRRASPSKKTLDAPQDGTGISEQEDPKQTAAREAASKPQDSSESEQKQEQNLEASQPTRPGEDIAESQEKEKRKPAKLRSGQGKGTTYAGAVKENVSTNGDTKESSSQNKQGSGDSGSVFGFNESMDASTDAMGRSGSIIDYAKDKAEDAKEEAQKATTS